MNMKRIEKYTQHNRNIIFILTNRDQGQRIITRFYRFMIDKIEISKNDRIALRKQKAVNGIGLTQLNLLNQQECLSGVRNYMELRAIYMSYWRQHLEWKSSEFQVEYDADLKY